MGKIVQFPDPKPIRRRSQPGRSSPWSFTNLDGKRPRKHPKVQYDHRGYVVLAVGQVWVEVYSQHLWVIKELREARSTLYPHDVVFARYGVRGVLRERLAELTFRVSYEVWDSFAGSRKVIPMKTNRPTV